MSFDKDKLIERLNLPSHIIEVSYGDPLIYCTVCAEGKFIKTYGQNIIKEFSNEVFHKQYKIHTPEYKQEFEKVLDFYVHDMKDFVTRHSSCSGTDEQKQWSIHCLA